MSQKVKGKDIQRPAKDEIDLFTVAKILWNSRKTVLKSILIFTIIGLFLAVFSKNKFTASTIILPSSQGRSIGNSGFGGLAAIAGINLGGIQAESGILPTLYPQIISSIPFQKELLQTTLTFEGQKSAITYEDYYTNYHSIGILGYLKKYTIELPGLLIKTINGKQKSKEAVDKQSGRASKIQIITNKEQKLINQLSEQLLLNVNTKDGYITLSVDMPEALAAAEMTQKVQELLQIYIINFKIQKSMDQLKFIEGRYAEKENKFKEAQQKLANFQDRNKFVNSERGKINLMQLQTNYDLAFTVFSELAKKLETQRIQVKEDTPVFTVIKPVSVPLKKSKPNRIIIIAIWIFLGLVTGVVTVFGSGFLNTMKKNWYAQKD